MVIGANHEPLWISMQAIVLRSQTHGKTVTKIYTFWYSCRKGMNYHLKKVQPMIVKLLHTVEKYVYSTFSCKTGLEQDEAGVENKSMIEYK